MRSFKHQRGETHLAFIGHVYCQLHKAAVEKREPRFDARGPAETIVTVQERAQVIAEFVQGDQISVSYLPATDALDLNADILVVGAGFKPIVQPTHDILRGRVILASEEPPE